METRSGSKQRTTSEKLQQYKSTWNSDENMAQSVEDDNVFGDIEAKLASPDSKLLLNAMSRMLQEFHEFRDEVSANIKTQETKHEDIEKRLRKLEEKGIMQGNTIIKLNTRVKELESNYESLLLTSKKNNLIFTGIPESVGTSDSEQVKSVLTTMKVDVEPESIYRRGSRQNNSKYEKPRPVVVKLKNTTDKNKVQANVRYLKGQPIYVNEDLPPQMLSEQRKLMPVLRVAKQYDRKSRISRGRLNFKGLNYNLIQAYTLPFIEEVSEKRTEDRIYFHGRFSMLSNFYPSPFVKSGVTFQTVEQYYQFMKATYHNKNDIATEILQSNDPSVAKSLGDKIKEQEDWKKDYAIETMYAAVKSKFALGKFEQYLKSTKEDLIVEASERDTFWGVGVSLQDAITKQPKLTSSNNKLGECLMKLRGTLKDQ